MRKMAERPINTSVTEIALGAEFINLEIDRQALLGQHNEFGVVAGAIEKHRLVDAVTTRIDKIASYIFPESNVAISGVATIVNEPLQMARGGNYKVTRINLQEQGKLNSKPKMPPEQKKIRRRKRKK